MLCAQGYHGTGIKAVLDQVQVPKGSFYNYFESKQDFGAEVIREYGRVLVGRLEETRDGAGADPLGALRRHYRSAVESFRRDGTGSGCLLCNLAAELGGSAGACGRALADTLTEARRQLSALLRLAQERGQIRADVEAPALARGVQDAWNGALIRMKAEGSVAPLEQFLALHLDRLLRP